MPFDTEYNKKIAKQILNANEEYIKRSNLTGSGLSGGFIEHLSNALYEHHLKKFSGDGRSGGSGYGASYDASGGIEKSEGVEGSGAVGGAFGRSIGGASGDGQHRYKKTSKSKLDKELMNMEMEGGNFFSDLGKGFMSVVKPVAGIAKHVLKVIPDPRAQAAGVVLDAVGAGSSGGADKKKRGRPAKLSLIPKSEMHSSSMSGMGQSGGGQSGGGQSGGGRSVRAGMVKDIMKKRGVSMIEASKIVKSEGLYKPMS